MTSKQKSNYYFWGITGENGDKMWDELHKHFEKLAKEDEEESARADDDGMPPREGVRD